MKKIPLTHLSHQIVLVAMSSICLLGVVYFTGNRPALVSIVSVFSLSYVLWGMFHHLTEKTFYPEIIAEYFSVALVGLVCCLALIFYV